jgi:glycosidase
MPANFLSRLRGLINSVNAQAVILLLCVAQAACVSVAQDRPYPAPPEWSHDKVMYEVNLRQFSGTGDIAGFRKQLPRLKELGVGILWFMPVHPIGVEARVRDLGSPYAVKDYLAFNPEFGTLEQFKALIDEAHALGMYVLIDWVPNHTAPDHPWVKEHPDWYTRDENGQLVPPIPQWADVVDLNYDAMDMRKAMIEAMAYWVREVGVDGFRVDTAEWQPLDFWVEARNELRKIKPIFMLAEGAKPELVEYAFDAAYAWDLTPNMNEIKAGTKKVTDLVNYLNAEARIIPNDGFRLNFTTNHDIDAWEATAVERLGDGLEAFTVLTFTVTGMPLIYNGQEARLEKQVDFFRHDPIPWHDDPIADLYRSLAELKHKNRALWHGGAGGELQIIAPSTNESVLTFKREADGDRVIVMLNLSGQPQSVPAPGGLGELTQVLGRETLGVAEGTCLLPPWGYGVWSGTRPK